MPTTRIYQHKVGGILITKSICNEQKCIASL